MGNAPCTSTTMESTTTVIIGSGLSGLAVASELSRKGVAAIVVSGCGGLLGDCSTHRSPADPSMLHERADLLRLLRTYARNHAVDIREDIHAADLILQQNDGGTEYSADGNHVRKWAVQTEQGVLMADNIVLTNCPQNQIRRVLKSVGITAGRDFLAAMRAIGIHLVGIGDLLAPTTREIVHQAKVVSEAIVSDRMLTSGPTAIA